MRKSLLSIAMVVWTLAFAFSQVPTINTITPINTSVEQYQKFEAKIDLNATYSNGYDYDEVALRAFISRPDGKIDTIDGFYFSPYNLNTSNGSLSPSGASTFMIRYAPSLVGEYNYVLLLEDKNGSAVSQQKTFTSTIKTTSQNKGFIKSSNTNYFKFDVNSQYIPIGENMCWQSGNTYTSYKTWLSKLVDNGGNFIRLWHAHWGLGVEWTNGNNYLGLKKYNQVTSAYQDWLYDYCAENGVYIMLALQHHGPVSTKVNPNWAESPYNAVNGGPCANTWDFFTNSEAKKLTKNRYRYIVARWAYSRAVMCWELFNEVEWTDNFETYKPQIITWHIEMANYIKSIDVYHHILSTSFANDQGADQLWNDGSMDLTQQHYYGDNASIHSAVSGLNRAYIDKYNKPTLMGEFGLGGNAPNATIDANGIYVHNSAWSTLMSGSAGTAMTWWWDNYIQPLDLYYHFKGMEKVANEVKFLADDMKPGTFQTSGAPADLQIYPSLGWSLKGDTLIKIENGNLTPAEPKLQTFLYGSQYNTQYRSPPSFVVNYTNAGKFTVKTAGSTSTAPTKIQISLDGQVKLEVVGAINTTYSIDVPQGSHRIKVDNSGTDWIGIASYAFSGQGSLVEAYGVVAKDGQSGAAWVLNRDYNHVNVRNNFLPSPVNTGMLTVNNVVNTDYKVIWYETLTGEILTTETVAATGNKLMMKIPVLQWDVAFRFERADLVSSKDIAFVEMNVFPNPVQRGTSLEVKVDKLIGQLSLAMFNAEGKLMHTFKTQANALFSLDLDGNLPSGIYWLKVSDEIGRVAVKAFVINE